MMTAAMTSCGVIAAVDFECIGLHDNSCGKAAAYGEDWAGGYSYGKAAAYGEGRASACEDTVCTLWSGNFLGFFLVVWSYFLTFACKITINSQVR